MLQRLTCNRKGRNHAVLYEEERDQYEDIDQLPLIRNDKKDQSFVLCLRIKEHYGSKRKARTSQVVTKGT